MNCLTFQTVHFCFMVKLLSLNGRHVRILSLHNAVVNLGLFLDPCYGLGWDTSSFKRVGSGFSGLQVPQGV